MKKKDQNKILVVDDEEINLTVLKDTLMAQGYEVISASSSAEAVQMTAEHLPDLILLDIIMQKKVWF
jgi:CheY-like chemotaxis protein